MFKTRFIAGTLLIGLIIPASGEVYAQEYPTKTIRIVTSAVGGSQDFLSRLIAQGISAPLGQPVIVENRLPVLGAELVAKAPADGYTLLTSGNLWVGPVLQKLSYDPVRDFAPITIVTKDSNVLTVHPSLPVKSVKELIALAKARPGQLNYAAVSIGGGSHLAAELFKAMAGVNLVRVAFKSSAESIMGVIGGEVHMTFGGLTVTPHIKSGKLKALAVTSAEPSPFLPGLPTIASTLPGYESVGINAIFAPAKTPAAIVKRLNQEIVRTVNQPDVRETLLNSRQEPVASSPEQLAAMMKSEIATLSKLIKDAGIKID